MLEKWRKTLDKGQNVCTVFIDLTKVFDTINHDLLLPKSMWMLMYNYKFMYSYLKDRREEVQVNNNFSSHKKVQAGVPQGSIGGPHFFNLNTNDLVLFLFRIFLSNYADCNNLYSIGKELDIFKEMLQKDFELQTD